MHSKYITANLRYPGTQKDSSLSLAFRGPMGKLIAIRWSPENRTIILLVQKDNDSHDLWQFGDGWRLFWLWRELL